jgi:hypothetical protein
MQRYQLMRWSLAAAVALTSLVLLGHSAVGRALTAAEGVDSSNAYRNVGSFMVWRDPNNPLGLPGGLAGYCIVVLIHPQTILTAGHCAARSERNLPLWVRPVVSFSPNALDESTWIDLNRALGTCFAHPSFPRPCTPQSCPFNDVDGLYEPGIADVGLCFLDEPVIGIQPAKLANGYLDEEGIAGTRMTIVGYGTTVPVPLGDTSQNDGIRRWGTSTVDQVVDQNWVTFNRDPVTVCAGDSGAPTFFNGRVVAIASDGHIDCASADVRARVDSKEVRNWIKSQIDQRFPE